MEKSQLDSLEPPVSQEEIAAVETQQTQQEPAVQQQEEKSVEQEKVEKVVPLQALHEARGQNKELKREIERMRSEQQQRDQILEQRIAALYQQQNAPKIPKYEEDPLTNVRGELDQVIQHQRAIQNEVQRTNQITQRQQYEAQVAHVVASAEAQFAQGKPDYAEALGFIRNHRLAQLKALGHEPHEAQQWVLGEAFQIAERCLQRGQNPAEVIYQMAEATGYKPKQQQQDPAQKIEALKKGAEAAKTLSGGGASGGKPTVEQIANMTEQEFADFMKTGGAKVLKEQLQ